jgi:hypothetical protein
VSKLAIKINWLEHRNYTVSAAISIGRTLDDAVLSGDVTMPSDYFKLFRETLTIGAMALNGVIDLQITEVKNPAAPQ